MSNVDEILARIGQGDLAASDDLLSLLYNELRALARSRLAAEFGTQSLQPTALVHETWLRLVGENSNNQRWDCRGHFFAAAATAMRRVLIDRARRKKSERRGGGQKPVLIDSGVLPVSNPSIDILDVEDALEELESSFPDHAEIVQMKFFGGLSHAEIASVLDISETTVKRHWRFAKAWLHRKLDD